MRRRLAVLAALTLLAAGCGAGESSGSGGPDQVKVGLISILDVAPIYLGKDKGFFAERNIELTLQPAEGGTETVPSVLSGNQQFGFSNVVTLLLAQSEGLPVKVVSNGTNSTGVDGEDFGALMVGAGSPIRSVRDLAGTKVAVNTFQNVVELAVRASALKAAGAAGLLLGLAGVPLIGTAAATGLVLFFVGAVGIHVWKRVFHNIAYPVVFLALATTVLVGHLTT